MTKVGTIAIALFFAAAQAALASEPGNPPDWCRNGAFASDQNNLRLVRVVRRTAFLDDSGVKNGCPQAGAGCAWGDPSSYPAPSEELLINSEIPRFVCAYRPKDGDGGWIAKNDVAIEAPQPTTQPPLSAWTGRWRDGDNWIRIKRRPRALSFDGHATWARQNFGDFEGTAMPAGAAANVSDSGCTVTMRLVGAYLVVDDNGQCGGMNVRFTGVYRR